MPVVREAQYTTKIIKAGALLGDTKMFLSVWDPAAVADENLARIRRENLLGKASRTRIADMLAIFRQRYLIDEHVTQALVSMVRQGVGPETADRVLYFHAARSDRLLHDFVVENLYPAFMAGRSDVSTSDAETVLRMWVKEGRTAGRWSDAVTRRVTQGLLATLRDFGILQGAVIKRLAPVSLTVEAFAYVAMCLRRECPSGERLVHHPDWRLFLLPPVSVERLFLEAHQRRLLEYHAAGSVIRITFPADSIEDYTRVVFQRAA